MVDKSEGDDATENNNGDDTVEFVLLASNVDVDTKVVENPLFFELSFLAKFPVGLRGVWLRPKAPI